MDFSSNKALAQSLQQITNGCKDDPEIAKLLKTMATIAMNEAGYISSGHYPVNEYYHYGLALEFYTHFTVSFFFVCVFIWILMERGKKKSLPFVDMQI